MKHTDFIELYKAYRRELSNFLYYKCGNMTLSEDLVQEVFVVVWKKRETILSKNIKSYIYTIANHLLIDHYRHQKVALELSHNYNSEPMAESPEYLLEIKEFDKLLQNAISLLSEKERVVFLMNRIDNLTFQEIAERLEISVKAVEKRMHNAVACLYERLNYRL